MKSILKVEGLTKWFGRNCAINNLSFDVFEGQVLGLLGPNGSGKTTTLSIILGIKYPTSGMYNWFDNPEGFLANKSIGSLIEVPYFYPYLSLERNLQIVARIKEKGYNDIPSILDMVGLAKRSKSKYFTLSLGMKQRLALASAMLADPSVLVLDEPTNGLDPEGIAEVRKIIIDQTQRGKTIIVASHILDEVEKVCSHVIILKNGSVLSYGSVKELLNEKQLVSIGTENIEKLLLALQNLSNVEIVESKGDRILISLKEGITTADINLQLVNMGVVPSTIEIHKKSLETQFLEIVK